MCDLIVVILTMYWPPVVVLTITGPYSDSGGHSTLRQRETHILPLPRDVSWERKPHRGCLQGGRGNETGLKPSQVLSQKWQR
jgi:hypothetical protein